LVEYEIQKEALETRTNAENISEAAIKIVFRRRMEFHVTNTFLQTLILIGVGYMSYYFEVDNFTDRLEGKSYCMYLSFTVTCRIMVTLTTMLVIATITSSIQSGLPKTSYYKMIDWWLFFSSNVLVMTMAFHTYLSYMCGKAGKKTHGGRKGLAATFLEGLQG